MKKLFMLIGLLTAVAAQGQLNKYDVNGDNDVTTADVVAIYNYIINGDDDDPEPEPENRVYTVNGVSFTMVAVAGGTFQMGSANSYSRERPVHDVTLSSYYVGQTVVTQALWEAVTGNNPNRSKGDNLPATMVSWYDCKNFITTLNSMTGQHFRLPTEAEWEFAARGGVKSKGYTYSGSNNADFVAWYDDNSAGNIHPVAMITANELGIYDMSGNVWEWCQDSYGDYSSAAQTNPTGPVSGSSRVVRGGDYASDALSCRSAYRDSFKPEATGVNIGLRLALSE